MADRGLILVAGLRDPQEPDVGVHAAVVLARQTGATLHLVHALVVPPPLNEAPDDPPAAEPVAAPDRLAAYAEYVESVCAPRIGAGDGTLAVVFHVVLGEPHDQLEAVARQVGADLLVVGAAPRWRPGHSRLGATARRVMRLAGFPVLAVRVPSALPSRLLLTTDLSAASGAALEEALDVVERLSPDDPPAVRTLLVIGPGVIPPPLAEDTLLREAERELEGFIAGRRPRPYPVETVVRTGAAPEEIAAEAALWGADLVLLGTHGRRGMQRIMLGSVAESTLAALECNALVVPPRVAASMNASAEAPPGATASGSAPAALAG